MKLQNEMRIRNVTARLRRKIARLELLLLRARAHVECDELLHDIEKEIVGRTRIVDRHGDEPSGGADHKHEDQDAENPL